MQTTLRISVAAALAALAIGSAMADPPARGPGYGMGPGMMGGYGPGYGPQGAPPAPQGGYGPGYGYGMGPGMMGGYGHGYGMGPGMMGGWGGYEGLDLTDGQREKLTAIQDGFAKKHWDVMGKMHDEQYRLRELYAAGKRDDAAIEKSFRRIEDLRRQMFDGMLDARKQTDSVLTPEQRNRVFRRGPRW